MYTLYIKQRVFKITDHYEVFDENKVVKYYVDQDFTFIGNRVNVSKADKSLCFVIEKVFLTLLPQYTVSFADGKLITIKANFSFFKKDIDLISDHYSLKIKGDFLDLDFEIYNGEVLVGRIDKEFLVWGDTYTIEVYDPRFEEELLAILLAVDNIKDRQERAR